MKRRKLLWLVVGAVVVLGGGFLWLRNGDKDKVSYRTAKVDRGNVTVTISATGTVSADTTVQVGSQVSGRIAKLYADFNTVVKKGQLLAQLDPTFLQAALNQAKAGLARAQATLNQTERDYKRNKDLFSKNLISQSDMDAALANYESAKANLLQAQAALEGADVNLEYATITSPISGVVISRNVDVGQTVAASLSAPTLFEIANDLKKMQVNASVDEADIGNVRKGQDVTFRVDAYPNDEFQGTVREIRLAPVISQNVVTYSVIINVANPDLKLMPGMTATVSITVANKDDVLRVPVQATKFSPVNADQLLSEWRAKRVQADSAMSGGPSRGSQRGQGQSWNGNRQGGNRSMVWILQNGKPEPRMITPGIQDGRFVEVVRSRLQEGDEVILGTNELQADAPRTQNPFQPQRPGGGRSGGRRSF